MMNLIRLFSQFAKGYIQITGSQASEGIFKSKAKTDQLEKRNWLSAKINDLAISKIFLPAVSRPKNKTTFKEMVKKTAEELAFSEGGHFEAAKLDLVLNKSVIEMTEVLGDVGVDALARLLSTKALSLYPDKEIFGMGLSLDKFVKWREKNKADAENLIKEAIDLPKRGAQRYRNSVENFSKVYHPIMNKMEKWQKERVEKIEARMNHVQIHNGNDDLRSVVLDGCEITSEKQDQILAEDQQWIVAFQGNNGFYEENLVGLEQISRDTGRNVLTVNYRGVGNSTGRPSKSQDLVDDGVTAVRSLIKKGVDPKNIIVMGHSTGGAIALQTLEHCRQNGMPLSAVVADRTFSTFKSCAKALVEQVIIGKTGFKTLAAKISKFAGWLVSKMNWEFDNKKVLTSHEGTVILFAHDQDGIINKNAQLTFNSITGEPLKGQKFHHITKMDESISETAGFVSKKGVYAHNVSIINDKEAYKFFLMHIPQLKSSQLSST